MGIFHVLLTMMLEKRVRLLNLKSAVSIDQFYDAIQCLHVGLHAVNVYM